MGQPVRAVLSLERKFQQRVQVTRIALTQGTQAAALRSGIPERTIRSWKRRYQLWGLEGLRDRSRRARHIASKKDQDGGLSEALFRLHAEEPGLNRLQVLAKLMSVRAAATPTLSWISRARRRFRLTRKHLKRENRHRLRYEKPEPGFLQIDTKFVPKAGEPGEYLYQFTAIDECTRVRYLSGALTHGAEAARKFLLEALAYYEGLGVRVKQVQTDNGTEFTLPLTEATRASYVEGRTPEAAFTRECQERGIRHRLIKPYSPELNGKVERSHRMDSERFYSRFEFAHADALDHALKHVWMPEYNEQRPHGALAGLTPMDFLRRKLTPPRSDDDPSLDTAA